MNYIKRPRSEQIADWNQRRQSDYDKWATLLTHDTSPAVKMSHSLFVDTSDLFDALQEAFKRIEDLEDKLNRLQQYQGVY